MRETILKGFVVSLGVALLWPFMAGASSPFDRIQERLQSARDRVEERRQGVQERLDKIEERIQNRREALCDRYRGRGYGPSFCDDTEPEPEPDAPTLSLSTDPGTITEGGMSQLMWESEDADSCLASGGWSGEKSLSGDQVVSPTDTTNYTLTCEGEGGEVTKSVTVTVEEPADPEPTLTLGATPLMITEGESSTLTWESTDVTTCTASDGWSGDRALSGSEAVTPTTDTTYTLRCEGDGGEVIKSATVMVDEVIEPELPNVVLSADPATITENGTSTLSWESTDADACIASDGWSGDKALTGSEVVTPATTTLYVLSCSNDLGTTTKETTVTVEDETGGGGGGGDPSGTILISEVYYDVADDKGAESANEWIELYNAGDSEADIAGWELSGDILPDGTTIAAGEYLVITNATTTADFWTLPSDTVYLESSLSGGLANGGDSVELLDDTGTPVDAVSYGSNVDAFDPSVPGVSEGVSIARNPVTTDSDTAFDWSGESTPTPGEPVFTNPTTPADTVVISEVYFDVASDKGAESANEWIELYNPTATSVDLVGWSVGASTTDADLIATTSLILAPGEYLIVAADTSATSTITFWDFSLASGVVSLGFTLSGGLANGGDEVRLYDASFAEIDAMSYGSDTDVFASPPDASAGESVSRDPRDNDTDLGSDWVTSVIPNPGS